MKITAKTNTYFSKNTFCIYKYYHSNKLIPEDMILPH